VDVIIHKTQRGRDDLAAGRNASAGRLSISGIDLAADDNIRREQESGCSNLPFSGEASGERRLTMAS
jgi:hypothetical protein